MTELDIWSGIVGFFMPLAVAFINQARWSRVVRGLVAFALCLVAAAVTVWVEGGLSAGEWRRSALVVVFAAITAYNLWWKPSTIAPRIERATSTR